MKVEAFAGKCPKCEWETIERSERLLEWVLDLHEKVVHRE